MKLDQLPENQVKKEVSNGVETEASINLEYWKGEVWTCRERTEFGEFINNQYIFIFEIPYIVLTKKFSLFNVFGLYVLTTYIDQTLYKEMYKK